MAGSRRATAAEAAVRRADVLKLRLAGFSETKIAAKLGVSAPTVSRDLAEIQQEWAARLGKLFDARSEIAESIACFGFLEAAAIRELIALEDTNGPTGSKMRCLWAARAMRQAKNELLMMTGLIGADAGVTPATTLPSAAEIRVMLLKAKVSEDDLISKGERAWLGMPARAVADDADTVPEV